MTAPVGECVLCVVTIQKRHKGNTETHQDSVMLEGITRVDEIWPLVVRHMEEMERRTLGMIGWRFKAWLPQKGKLKGGKSVLN